MNAEKLIELMKRNEGIWIVKGSEAFVGIEDAISQGEPEEPKGFKNVMVGKTRIIFTTREEIKITHESFIDLEQY